MDFPRGTASTGQVPLPRSGDAVSTAEVPDPLAVALAERDAALVGQRRLRKANLLLHQDIERVRMEVGGTRRTRIEWRVEHPLRAPLNFGTDEESARRCVTNQVEIWGPGGWRLRSRLAFLGDWRDEDFRPADVGDSDCQHHGAPKAGGRATDGVGGGDDA